MKITCSIIEDLLPLYAEDILSDDSVTLVEEHLSECQNCRRHLDALRAEATENYLSASSKKIEEGQKGALLKIKRKIRRRQIAAVLIAVLLVGIIARTGYYFYYEKTTHIAWEDTGLYVKDGRLYSSKPYYGRLSSFVSPDQTIDFLYMRETPYIRRLYPDPSNSGNVIIDFQANSELDPNEYHGETGIPGLKKVYYLPEECYEEAAALDYEDLEHGAQQTAELEKKCILIWEKEDYK